MPHRIVLTTWGSLGDLHPYLAVAIGLKQRGHAVTIVATEYYRAKVEGEGIAFVSSRPDFRPLLEDRELFRRANDLRRGTEYVVRELVLPSLDESYTDLRSACLGAALLVGHPLAYAVPIVAEELRLPWLSVALAPGSLLSRRDPPLVPQAPWLHYLGPAAHEIFFRFVGRLTRSWARPIEALRTRLGLPAARLHPLLGGTLSPYGTLALFSHVLAMPQPDWPPRTELTGFPFYDRREPGQTLEPGLSEFLDAGERPVIFTLGSAAVMDARDFFEQSLEAIRRLRCRAVLLVGPDARNALTGRGVAGVYVTEYAPYSELLPRGALTVHQGGIGTTGQALRAGRPMLVVPFSHDQPDNALRVERLGVARVLPRARYRADRLVPILQELLGSEAYRQRAAQIGQMVANEDGVRAACDALERAVERFPAGTLR